MAFRGFSREFPNLGFIRCLSVALLALLPCSVTRADANPCAELTTPKLIVQCALQNHPETQRARASLQQANQLEAVAGQRPNPELESKAVFGNAFGDQVSGVEVNLALPLELGGKRSARLERASAELDSTKASLLKSQEEVFIETMRSLYRFRQIRSEHHALTEALQTFRKIQAQFKTRPRLGPDQAVSLAVFQVAEADYELRKALLDTESVSVLRALSLAVGKQFTPPDSALPPRNDANTWPQLEAAGPYKGSAFRLVEADLKLSQADLSLAQSQSWPNLLVGPSVERTVDGPISFFAYGFNLSIAIPILNVNSGGRAFAVQGLVRAETNLEVRRRELDTQRDVLIERYRFTTKALKGSVSSRALETKHRQMEELFARGLIQSSLVIEAHRQIVDFTKDQNELELSALEALWQVYALEGRLSEAL